MTELKNALKSRESKSEIINIEDLNFEDQIFLGENGEYLREKAYQVALISVKSVLGLGKIFKEVFEKLGNQNNGTYEKWIVLSGFNKKTAFRYRKKYELYSLVDFSKKEIVALFPFSIIDKITFEEIIDVADAINKGVSIQELPLSIESKNENKLDISLDNFDISIVNKLFQNFSNNFEKLNDKKKLEISKLLNKVEVLLSETE